MTDEQITSLVAARNAITDRTDEYQNMRAVDHIDTVLRDVPAGQRSDVDALLGRICSVFEQVEREVTKVSITADMAQLETIDQGRRDWNSIKGDLDI